MGRAKVGGCNGRPPAKGAMWREKKEGGVEFGCPVSICLLYFVESQSVVSDNPCIWKLF